MQLSQSKSFKWILLFSLAAIWGGAFILIKRGLSIDGVPTISSGQVGSIRILISFLFFLPIAIRQFKKIPKDKLKWILVIGALGNLFPAYLFATAQKNFGFWFVGRFKFNDTDVHFNHCSFIF